MGARTTIAASLHGARRKFPDYSRNFCPIPVAAFVFGPSATRHSADHAMVSWPRCASARCLTDSVAKHGICIPRDICSRPKLGKCAPPRTAQTAPHVRPLPFRPIADLPVCGQLPQPVQAEPLGKKLPFASTFRIAPGLASHKSAMF